VSVNYIKELGQGSTGVPVHVSVNYVKELGQGTSGVAVQHFSVNYVTRSE
jgi:hypothetical protein